MSMTILNNSATAITLGELNKNIVQVGKSLAKISKGQKINSAGDDASAYGISEQMRAKIRALEQDVQNVQNGSSMLKTALGGIQNIVDELRELKELAIDAANDSNTDADRAVMQKVLKQKQANIDCIAAGTTFNSKALLDGTYQNPHWREFYTIEYYILDGGFSTEDVVHRSMVLPKTLNIIKQVEVDLNTADLQNKDININVTEKLNTSVKGLASAFEAMHNGVIFGDGTRSVETRDTALYAQRPENIKNATPASNPEKEEAIYDMTRDSVTPNRNFIRASGGAPLAVRLDFSGARYLNEEENVYKPLFGANGMIDPDGIDALTDQGFSILSSDSSHFVNIKFIAGSTNADYFNQLQEAENTDNTGDIEYRVDISGFEGTNADFVNHIFQQIRDEVKERPYPQTQYKLNAGLSYITDNKNNIALSQQFNLRMARDTDGNVYLTKLEPYSYTLGILDEGFLQNKYIVKDGTPYSVGEGRMYKEYLGNPLWIQHGDKAGQHMNVYINSMYNSALGTDAIDVSTRDRALASIDYIDVALEYALDQATSVGAYLERMEITDANVETENENTQAAESTIRDADMAKEMVGYAKNNVLFQASQSMLAQANQLMSSVLGLLQ